ncbi:deoxyribonuclease V [bacterium]|nr:deoxyribonuclease V [bacterium]
MKLKAIHNWDVTIEEAKAIQLQLAPKVLAKGGPSIKDINFIAGCDVAFDIKNKIAYGSLVLMSYPDLEILSTISGEASLRFPYIPGFLTFREMEVLLKLFKKLEIIPDVVLADGQGIAHPRGIGLASHLGLFLDIPTIGCAKSRLVGTWEEVGPNKGDNSPLIYKSKEIGKVLRTRDNVKPIFVSPGHLISIENASRIALSATTKYRIPEPTRQADKMVAKYKNEVLCD